MSDSVTMYEFIGTSAGFEVLYYLKDGRFHMEPVVAWAISERDGSTKAFPITTDCEWALDDERTIMGPDGSIRCGDLEHWDHVADWLADMSKRENSDRKPPRGPALVIVSADRPE